MADVLPAPEDSRGRLSENVMQFARLLRAAGVPAGPGRVLDAVESLSLVDVSRRDDFYWALRSIFVHKRSQTELFDQAFRLFWRDPLGVNAAMALLLPQTNVAKGKGTEPEPLRRIQEAAARKAPPPPPKEPKQEEEITLDAVLTASPDEVLAAKDFEQMSAEEVRRAKAAIRRMRLAALKVPTRRLRPDPHGPRIDLRSTVRASLRSGGKDIPLRFRQRSRRPPPLVVLCDISGSMERYSRLMLHFIHALTTERRRVESFVFGTRLTKVTRAMRYRDVDEALARCGQEAQDWGGGTRIGDAVREFNRRWGRRVLGQGAIVLLVTDGLERDDPALLRAEAERLSRSCRRLLWLNPLLRWEGFEPTARGAAVLHHYVDEMRPVHNLESLEQLCAVLSEGLDMRARRARAC